MVFLYKFEEGSLGILYFFVGFFILVNGFLILRILELLFFGFGGYVDVFIIILLK